MKDILGPWSFWKERVVFSKCSCHKNRQSVPNEKTFYDLFIFYIMIINQLYIYVKKARESIHRLKPNGQRSFSLKMWRHETTRGNFRPGAQFWRPYATVHTRSGIISYFYVNLQSITFIHGYSYSLSILDTISIFEAQCQSIFLVI